MAGEAPLIGTVKGITDDVIYIAPLKLFQFRHFPQTLCALLHGNGGRIQPDQDLNLMMDGGSHDQKEDGQLDALFNMWICKCESKEDISTMLERFTKKFTVLNALLVEKSAFSRPIEVPMVLFLNNKSRGIRSLQEQLETVKETWKTFSFELDFGPVVETWALRVLKREFNCVGARFCITNGASFNHILDWRNILTCLPCLPCGLMAGSIYRLRRKLRYEEEIWRPATQVVLVNSEGPEDIEQRHALIQLMNWTKDKYDQMAAVDTENSENLRQSAVLSVFSLDTDVTNNPPLDTGEYRKGGNSKKGSYNKDANRDDEIELSTFKTQINQPEKVTVSHNRKDSLELLQDASGLPVVDIDGDLLANRHMLSFLSPSFVERGKITNGREAVYTADYRVRRNDRKLDTMTGSRHNDRKFSTACPQVPEVSNRDARQIEVKSGKTTSKKKKTLNVKAVTTDSIV